MKTNNTKCINRYVTQLPVGAHVNSFYFLVIPATFMEMEKPKPKIHLWNF